MLRSAIAFAFCAMYCAGAVSQVPVKAHLLSKAEATIQAQKFFDREIVVEGALLEPSLKGNYWAFPVALGVAGVTQPDPVLVDRRSGAASWAGLEAHKAFRKRINQ